MKEPPQRKESKLWSWIWFWESRFATWGSFVRSQSPSRWLAPYPTNILAPTWADFKNLQIFKYLFWYSMHWIRIYIMSSWSSGFSLNVAGLIKGCLIPGVIGMMPILSNFWPFQINIYLTSVKNIFKIVTKSNTWSIRLGSRGGWSLSAGGFWFSRWAGTTHVSWVASRTSRSSCFKNTYHTINQFEAVDFLTVKKILCQPWWSRFEHF